MRIAALAFLLAGAAFGASLGGSIIDNFSGRVLSGATIVVQKLEEVGISTVQVAGGRRGRFDMHGLPEGRYLLTVTRKGFLPLRYGQKTWKGAARPFMLEADAKLYLQLRMQRQGAITGTVYDENDVGISDLEVIALRATRPPVPVKRARTDDRGFYRIGELEPGRYYVRSAAELLPDQYTILPTLHRETQSLEMAIPVDVAPEDVVPDVSIRPMPGRLLRLDAEVVAPPSSGPWQMRLVSETVDRQGGESAVFDRLAPGRYELYAEGFINGQPASGYLEFELDRDNRVSVQVGMSHLAELRLITTEGGPAPEGLVVEARRRSLAGTGQPQALKPGRALLPAGRWELNLPPNPNAYLFSRSRGPANGGGLEIRIAAGDTPRLALRVSLHPATIRGRVVDAGGQPAAGAPVYVEPWDPAYGQRVGDPRSTTTGVGGDFEVTGLPPGTYRLLSTFDWDQPEPSLFNLASPKAVEVKESGRATVDLELFIQP